MPFQGTFWAALSYHALLILSLAEFITRSTLPDSSQRRFNKGYRTATANISKPAYQTSKRLMNGTEEQSERWNLENQKRANGS